MASVKSILVASGLAAGVLLSAGGTLAATLIIGGGAAKECSTAAIGGRSDLSSIHSCNLALDTESLSFRDRARTFVNRGVLQMRRREFDAAVRDFDSASQIDPQLGEAYVNRGAAYVGTKRYGESLTQIDQGLALGVKDPEKAFYNRAIANENLGDVTAAYRDYSKASALDPDWAAPKQELTRFTVKRP